MEFQVKQGNYIKDENSTTKIMNNVILAMIPLILFWFYQNGIKLYQNNNQIYTLFKPLIVISVATLLSILLEYLWNLKAKKKLKDILKEECPIIPPLVLVLITPINLPIIYICISIILMVTIKSLFKGFNQNAFNPAATGYIISLLIYFAINYITTQKCDISIFENNLLQSLNNLNNITHTSITNITSLKNLLIGNIYTITSPLLLIGAFIYLCYKRAIKWRITASYITTMFIITILIGFAKGYGTWYPIYYLLTSSHLFIAVLMATDPVTSPITSFGQFMYATILVILTLILNYYTNITGIAIIALLIMNLYNYLIIKLKVIFKFNKPYRILYTTILLFITITLSIIIPYTK